MINVRIQNEKQTELSPKIKVVGVGGACGMAIHLPAERVLVLGDEDLPPSAAVSSGGRRSEGTVMARRWLSEHPHDLPWWTTGHKGRHVCSYLEWSPRTSHPPVSP